MSEPQILSPTCGTPIRWGFCGAPFFSDPPVPPFMGDDFIGRNIWGGTSSAGDEAKQRSEGWECHGGGATLLKGNRSLSVALPWMLDLYPSLRPVGWFQGVPTAVKEPGSVDMVILRERTYGISPGIEFEREATDASLLLQLRQHAFPERSRKSRFRETSGVGINPMLLPKAKRAVDSASVAGGLGSERNGEPRGFGGNRTGGITGAFRRQRPFGSARARRGGTCIYSLAQHGRIEEEKGEEVAKTARDGLLKAGPVLVKDANADIALQQALLQRTEFDVIATLDLSEDYLSDALAAQVGGIGIAPGGKVNYVDGPAIFEATQGTAPQYAGQDKVNPGTVTLDGEKDVATARLNPRVAFAERPGWSNRTKDRYV